MFESVILCRWFGEAKSELEPRWPFEAANCSHIAFEEARIMNEVVSSLVTQTFKGREVFNAGDYYFLSFVTQAYSLPYKLALAGFAIE